MNAVNTTKGLTCCGKRSK